MITQAHIQERLSYAYLYAISGRAGLAIAKPEPDYGVDAQLRPVARLPGRMSQSGFGIDVQLKATMDWSVSDQSVVYDLSAKAYNMMAGQETGEIPLYLFLFCLPKDLEGWLGVTEDELVLRNCCYWYRASRGVTRNANSIRIEVPRRNLLTVSALESLMVNARSELVR